MTEKVVQKTWNKRVQRLLLSEARVSIRKSEKVFFVCQRFKVKSETVRFKELIMSTTGFSSSMENFRPCIFFVI